MTRPDAQRRASAHADQAVDEGPQPGRASGFVKDVGSGGMDALSAARALLAHTELDARAIATEALKIAGDICIYTNQNIVVEQL